MVLKLKSMIEEHRVSLSEITYQDVKLLMSYWYDSPEDFVKGMSVNRQGMPEREVFTKKLHEKIDACQRNPNIKSNYLAIKLDSKTIGVHSLSDILDGESAVFHAHIFEQQLRGKGIGKISYLKAFGIFFKRFNLETLEFKTPIVNTASNKLKQSLGIEAVERIVLNKPHLLPGTEAIRYVLPYKRYENIYMNFLNKKNHSSLFESVDSSFNSR